MWKGIITMKGHFLVCENPDEELDISFQVNETLTDDIPEEQQLLYLNAEATCNVIKSLEKTEETTKKKYIKKLVSLSQVGLVADPAQTKAANLALEKLQEEIVLVEGKRIKNEYMRTLGLEAFCIGVIVSIITYIAHYYTKQVWVYCIWAVIIGALSGTWISFGARKFEIEFKDLSSLENDKMGPMLRLIYISVAALIFTIFMNVGLFQIKIGNLDTSNSFNDMKSAIVIGLISGLIESRIGVSVYKKATSIFGD